jgi:Acetoacetate decarboxylase (ADC)
VSVRDQYHLLGSNKELDISRAPTLSAYNGASLRLENASIHYCLLEVPVAQTLAMLPPGLHPSLPGVIASLHYHSPASELGPFDLLTTALFCRCAAKHRMMTLSAFTNNAKAQAFFREGWGYQPTIADIKLAVHYDRVRSIVSVSDTVLLDVATDDPIALTGPGASVRYAQTLNLARTPHGLKFVQVDVSYEFKSSARGVPRFHVYAGARLGDPNPVPANPVSGTLVRADVVFGPVKFLADPAVSAEAGGISLVPQPEKATA